MKHLVTIEIPYEAPEGEAASAGITASLKSRGFVGFTVLGTRRAVPETEIPSFNEDTLDLCARVEAFSNQGDALLKEATKTAGSLENVLDHIDTEGKILFEHMQRIKVQLWHAESYLSVIRNSARKIRERLTGKPV